MQINIIIETAATIQIQTQLKVKMQKQCRRHPSIRKFTSHRIVWVVLDLVHIHIHVVHNHIHQHLCLHLRLGLRRRLMVVVIIIAEAGTLMGMIILEVSLSRSTLIGI